MAFNGSGLFSRIYNFETDRDGDIKIRADRVDGEFDGMATGLSKAILKDGQQTITANIPFNAKKITNLGDATAPTDALNQQSGDARYLAGPNNLSDLDNAGTSRTNLGLGAVAVLDAVDTDQIEDAAVTTQKLNDLSVTAAKIVDGVITTAKMVAGSITTSLLADNSVTLDKTEHGTSGDILYYGASGEPFRLAKGTDDQVLTLASGLPSWADAGGYNVPQLHVQDRKSSGNDGGTFTSGAWRKRTLDDIQLNEIGATISSSEITLLAGTYEISCRCPAVGVGQHKARLYNNTDGAVVLYGSSSWADSGEIGGSDSIIQGKFTIVSTKVVEVQHRCTTTYATHGFGTGNVNGDEVYTDCILKKVA